MSVNIRTATPDDVKVLQDLNYKLFVSDQRHFNDLNLDWPYQKDGEEYFTKVATQQSNTVGFIAVDDTGTAVGYLAGCITKSHSAYTGKRAELENMFVEEAFRSQGIGAKLVAAFVDWCKSKNADHVFVGAYSPNTQALAFYRQQGFSDYTLNLRIDLNNSK